MIVTTTLRTVRYMSSAMADGEPTLTVPVDSAGVPHVQAGELRDFLTRWRAIDPDGTWDPAALREVDGALCYADDCGEYEWLPDTDSRYTLTDWPWALT